MEPFDISSYRFHFIDVDILEDFIVKEVCNECEGQCTGTSPLDVFCKHHIAVKKFTQCAIAGDMAIHNWPLYREFTGGSSPRAEGSSPRAEGSSPRAEGSSPKEGKQHGITR